MASLTLVVQDREVRKFVLDASVTTIGRAQDNDIVINNLALSRRHAEVHRRGGTYEVLDRGSQNGVYVNESRIEGPHALRDTDVIKLGTYTFVFGGDPPEPEIPEVQSGPRRRRRPAERAPSPPSEEPTPPPAPIEPATPPPEIELSPSSVPMAVLTYNELELQRLELVEEEALVGRAKECDIQIPERRLSRRHCLLFRDDDGRWQVKDLGSQNGTYVNRRKVRDTQLLRHGDVLNFAEYAVMFLSDTDAYEPEVEAPPVAPRPSSGFEQEQTELPEAFPQLEQLSKVSEPVVSEPPRARRSRAEPSRARSEARERPARRLPSEAVVSRLEARPTRARSVERAEEAPWQEENSAPRARRESPPKPRAPSPPPFEGVDVPDPKGDAPRPDPGLDEWYSARESDEYEEEPSVLLERSKSSMSQLLSTMMVDKGELDKNLEVARRKRRFGVRVESRGEVLFDGLLEHDVTVLGAEAESDLPLRGRYVSGRHSLLVRVRESLLLVRLGSSSAARVNGLPRLQAFLKSGDVIQIDETQITIREQ